MYFDEEEDEQDFYLDKSQEVKFIAEVEKRPLLYTTKSKGYKDMVEKDNLWKEIEECMEIPAELLKKKWKNLRDYFARYRKKPSKRKTQKHSLSKRKRIEQRRIHRLSFLDYVTRPIPTFIDEPDQISSASLEPETSNADDLNIECVAGSSRNRSGIATNSEVENSRTKGEYEGSNDFSAEGISPDDCDALDELEDEIPTKRRKSSFKEMYLKELQQSRDERMDILRILLQSSSSKDHIDNFFESISCTVKRFPEHLIIQAKKQVSDIICNLEEEALE